MMSIKHDDKDYLTQYFNIQVLCQKKNLILLILLLILFAGCSRRYSDIPAYWPIPYSEYNNEGVGRFKTSYLVEQIDKYYRGSDPGPIGVTTLVNLDDLYTTSSFGRMYAEQLMSELTMKGYDVIELRHADALQVMNESGEFALSRDTAVLRSIQKLGGVVVGTYVVSPDRVYINARLLDPKTSLILSAGSVEMTKTDEMARLIRGGSVPTSMERIPVKHLQTATFPAFMFPGGLNNKYAQEEDSFSHGNNASQLDKHAPTQHAPKVVPELK